MFLAYKGPVMKHKPVIQGGIAIPAFWFLLTAAAWADKNHAPGSFNLQRSLSGDRRPSIKEDKKIQKL